MTSRTSLNRGRSGAAVRGQTLVEFALVFPLFIVMVFGLIDVGRLVYMHSTLSQAAREGARLAAVEASWMGSSDASCGAVGGPVCPANVTALQTHVVAAVNRMVAPFGSVAGSQVYVQCTPPASPPTGEWTGVSCMSKAAKNTVSVRVEMTFGPITPLNGVVGPITTSASASMVIN
ncbi:MAG: TadE/TadG family type IV pilus assembly protein [Aeromicrobium sp.]